MAPVQQTTRKRDQVVIAGSKRSRPSCRQTLPSSVPGGQSLSACGIETSAIVTSASAVLRPGLGDEDSVRIGQVAGGGRHDGSLADTDSPVEADGFPHVILADEIG